MMQELEATSLTLRPILDSSGCTRHCFFESPEPLLLNEELEVWSTTVNKKELEVGITDWWRDFLKSGGECEGFYYSLSRGTTPNLKTVDQTFYNSDTLKSDVRECCVDSVSDYIYNLEITNEMISSYTFVYILVKVDGEYNLAHCFIKDEYFFSAYCRNLIYLDYRYLQPRCDIDITGKTKIIEHSHDGFDDHDGVKVRESDLVFTATDESENGFVTSRTTRDYLKLVSERNPLDFIPDGTYDEEQISIDRFGNVKKLTSSQSISRTENDFSQYESLTDKTDVGKYQYNELDLTDKTWIAGQEFALYGLPLEEMEEDVSDKYRNILYIENPDLSSREVKYRKYGNLGFTNKAIYEISSESDSLELPSNCDVDSFIGVFKNGVMLHPSYYTTDENGNDIYIEMDYELNDPYIVFTENLERDDEIVIWFTASANDTRTQEVIWYGEMQFNGVRWEAESDFATSISFSVSTYSISVKRGETVSFDYETNGILVDILPSVQNALKITWDESKIYVTALETSVEGVSIDLDCKATYYDLTSRITVTVRIE